MTLTPDALAGLRQSYKKSTLRKDDCSPLPSGQFALWLKDALDAACEEPNAFTLSTIDQGRPAARVVLLKGLYREGLIFYTNYHSPKGVQLGQSPVAAATFLWLPLERQVRVVGKIEKVPEDMSDAYFASRPYGSQIGALASRQGEVVSSREELEKNFSDCIAQHPLNQPIPRPAHWGGYVILPESWEFWQGRENRMHDRIRYRLENGAWIKERLAP